MKKELLIKLISAGAAVALTAFVNFSALASDGETLFFEDYEGESFSPLNSGKGVVETDAVTGNKFMHVTGAWSANQFGYAFPEVKEGKIKVSFDYMKKDLSKQTYVVLANNNFYSGKEWFRLFGVSGAGQMTALTNADGIGKMEADKWYTQEVTVDMDTREATANLYEQGGDMPIATLHYDYVPTNTSSYGYGGWPETSKSFLRFRHFGDNDGYLDNIEIKYIYDEPTLTTENITIMNAKGDVQSNKQEAIASATVIKIDFRTYMDESTLNSDTVYVTKKGETEKIPATVTTKRTGHKVSVTLSADKKWIPGEYTIHVSEGVKNIVGDTLDGGYTEDFTVISGKVAKVSFLDIDANEVNMTESEKIAPEIQKIIFWLSGEVSEDYLSGISVKNEGVEVEGERNFNIDDNTYTIRLDKYLKQNSNYTVSVPYEVVGNAFEGSFETGEGTYKVLSVEFCDAEGNVTTDSASAKQLVVKIVNTKEVSEDYRLIFTSFDEKYMKNMQYMDFSVSESDSNFEASMPVEVAEDANLIKSLLWKKTDADADVKKELVDCEISDEGKITVSGVMSDTSDKKIKVTVFRPGKSQEDILELSENIDVVAYADNLKTGEDGTYSFSFLVDSGVGFYDVTIETEDGNIEEFTIFYNDRNKALEIKAELNDTKTEDEFYNLLYGEDENFKELGFYLNLEDEVDARKVSDLLYQYISENDKLSDNDIEAIKLFRKMYAIELLNEEKEISIQELEEYINVESEEFYQYYDKEYIKESVKKEIFENLSGCDYKSYKEYEDAFLKELILKTVRYADGYGNVRDILSDYEDETKIKTDSLNSSNYSKVLGKSYDDYADLKDAITAKKTAGGGSGGSGGGSSSSKKPSVSITVDSSYVTMPEATPVEKEIFSDIKDYAWAKEAIETLYKNGAINGKTEDLFVPQDNITREEFVAIIVRVLGVDYKVSDVVFSDVLAGAWYEKYISAAVAEGIVSGKDDGTFGVGENITRQDMAVMMCRALKAEVLSESVEFADDADISEYAKSSVYTMKNKGIINGFADGNFMPKKNATRAEAAVMIYRGLYN